MKDILLVNVNNLGTFRSSQIVSESLGLGSLCASLEQEGLAVTICDARLFRLTPQEAAEYADDVFSVGISMFSESGIEWVQQFVHLIKTKHPNLHIIFGGYYPTLTPERVLDFVPESEIVVLGEGEVTTPEVIWALRKGLNLDSIAGIFYRKIDGSYKRNKDRPIIENLDNLPYPRRYAHKFADDYFEAHIESSRGCLNHCTFCAIKPFFRNSCGINWRGKSAQRLFEEFVHVTKEYPNVRRIRFVDPDFIGSETDGISRAVEFCRLVKESGMTDYQFFIETRVSIVSKKHESLFLTFREVGLREVLLGIESSSQKILKIFNKQISPEDSLYAVNLLREWEIDFVFGFMMFTPWTEYSDIVESIVYLRKLRDISFHKLFHTLDIIPQTPIVGIAKKDNLLTGFNKRGYISYRYKPEIENIRKVWNYIQIFHIDFLDQIYFTYKDIKTWTQSKSKDAICLLDQLTELSLNLFNELCNYAVNNTVSIDTFDETINKLIEYYSKLCEKLHEQSDKNYRLPETKYQEIIRMREFLQICGYKNEQI